MAVFDSWNVGGRPSLTYSRSGSEMLETLLQSLGWENIGLVYSKSAAQAARRANALSAIEKLCRVSFQAPSAHMPMDECLDLAVSMSAEHFDGVIVLGGGSAIDAVKIAQVILGLNMRSIDELETQAASGLVLGPSFAPPFEAIAIPTTLSAAEHGSLAGVTSPLTKRKYVVKAPRLDACAVVLDANLAMETPRNLWVASGMRAVDHAIEGYLSKKATPLTNGFAEIGLRHLASGLRETASGRDSLKAREIAQIGAWFAGSLIGEVSFGASHAIGHQLGSMFGVSHGHTSSILLPAVLDFNEPVDGHKQKDISRWLGLPDLDAGRAVRSFVEEIGLPATLTSVGVGREERENLAEACLHGDTLESNPRQINGLNDLRSILREAA